MEYVEHCLQLRTKYLLLLLKDATEVMAEHTQDEGSPAHKKLNGLRILVEKTTSLLQDSQDDVACADALLYDPMAWQERWVEIFNAVKSFSGGSQRPSRKTEGQWKIMDFTLRRKFGQMNTPSLQEVVGPESTGMKKKSDLVEKAVEMQMQSAHAAEDALLAQWEESFAKVFQHAVCPSTDEDAAGVGTQEQEGQPHESEKHVGSCRSTASLN